MMVNMCFAAPPTSYGVGGSGYGGGGGGRGWEWVCGGVGEDRGGVGAWPLLSWSQSHIRLAISWVYYVLILKGNSHMISPDRTRLISILLSNSRLPGHLSPDLWHSMLIILILLIHATTRQQWNASWQSKRRRSAQILSTAIVTVALALLATRTGMKRVGTRPDGRRCHVPVWTRWNTASYIFGSRMLRPSTDIPARIILP